MDPPARGPVSGLVNEVSPGLVKEVSPGLECGDVMGLVAALAPGLVVALSVTPQMSLERECMGMRRALGVGIGALVSRMSLEREYVCARSGLRKMKTL